MLLRGYFVPYGWGWEENEERVVNFSIPAIRNGKGGIRDQWGSSTPPPLWCCLGAAAPTLPKRALAGPGPALAAPGGSRVARLGLTPPPARRLSGAEGATSGAQARAAPPSRQSSLSSWPSLRTPTATPSPPPRPRAYPCRRQAGR